MKKIKFIDEAGSISRFTGVFFKESWISKFEFEELLKQCYVLGNKSFPLVSFTAFVMGLVITIQSHPSMEAFGTESWLPAVVSISLIREIVPVVTAVICAGKIGSAIGAELGSMKVTEQIDAMEVSGTNPFKYLVVTRVIATTLMLPILVILGDLIGLLGSYVAVIIKEVMSIQLFFNEVFLKLTFGDVFPSVVKSYFFGFAIGIIGCFMGFNTRKGTEGVGQAANFAVVISIFVVFIIDLLSAQIADLLNLIT
jgi:phospholipid/cholesterol/gamma-HCH transport system permease protein